MSLFSEVTEFQIPNELAILRYIFKIDNVIMKAPWYQLKKISLIHYIPWSIKKLIKHRIMKNKKKKPSRIQYVQRLNKLVLLLHTYVKINNNVIIKALWYPFNACYATAPWNWMALKATQWKWGIKPKSLQFYSQRNSIAFEFIRMHLLSIFSVSEGIRF